MGTPETYTVVMIAEGDDGFVFYVQDAGERAITPQIFSTFWPTDTDLAPFGFAVAGNFTEICGDEDRVMIAPAVRRLI